MHRPHGGRRSLSLYQETSFGMPHLIRFRWRPADTPDRIRSERDPDHPRGRETFAKRHLREDGIDRRLISRKSAKNVDTKEGGARPVQNASAEPCRELWAMSTGWMYASAETSWVRREELRLPARGAGADLNATLVLVSKPRIAISASSSRSRRQ